MAKRLVVDLKAKTRREVSMTAEEVAAMRSAPPVMVLPIETRALIQMIGDAQGLSDAEARAAFDAAVEGLQ